MAENKNISPEEMEEEILENEEINDTAEEETVEEAEEAVAEEPETEKEKGSFFKKKEKKDKKDEKIEELTDRVRRQMAEFDNFRKRTEKEKTQMFETGAKSIVEKILPVVDNFERGLAAVTEEEKGTPFVEGMEKIYKQMMTVLEEAGVNRSRQLERDLIRICTMQLCMSRMRNSVRTSSQKNSRKATHTVIPWFATAW